MIDQHLSSITFARKCTIHPNKINAEGYCYNYITGRVGISQRVKSGKIGTYNKYNLVAPFLSQKLKINDF